MVKLLLGVLSRQLKSKPNQKTRSFFRALIITQNGKPAGVLLSPNDYGELVYRKSFLDSVGRGLSDAESGKTYCTEEIRAAFATRRSKGLTDVWRRRANGTGLKALQVFLNSFDKRICLREALLRLLR